MIWLAWYSKTSTTQKLTAHFTVADSNTFLSPKEILLTAPENIYLGKF